MEASSPRHFTTTVRESERVHVGEHVSVALTIDGTRDFVTLYIEAPAGARMTSPNPSRVVVKSPTHTVVTMRVGETLTLPEIQFRTLYCEPGRRAGRRRIRLVIDTSRYFTIERHKVRLRRMQGAA